MQSAHMEGWTVSTELLAQLVEEVALLTSDRRRAEPRTVTRPTALREARAASEAGGATRPEPPAMNGHRKMLMAAKQREMIRNG